MKEKTYDGIEAIFELVLRASVIIACWVFILS